MTSDLLDRLRAAIADVTPAAAAAEAARSSSVAFDRLGDEAWWDAALPSLYAAVGPLVEQPYGVEVDGVLHPAARRCRWDEVLAELLSGVAVRLQSSPVPAVQLTGLRTVKFLQAWSADCRRTADVEAALGLPPLPAEWPGWAYEYLVTPVEYFEGSLSTEPRSALVRMAIDGALGIRSAMTRHLGPPPARAWCWPWEWPAADGDAAWTDEGNPVPTPVVVPVDWSLDWVDLYGFSTEAVPGELLVVEPERVLRAWSGRLQHYGPMRSRDNPGVLSQGYTTWTIGHPVPMRPEDVTLVVPSAADDDESVVATHTPHQRPALEPVAVDPEPTPAELHQQARDAALGAFSAWHGRGATVDEAIRSMHPDNPWGD